MAFFQSVAKQDDDICLDEFQGRILDDYDPRKPMFIRPATNAEIMQGEVDLKMQQIASLYTLVVRLDSQENENPNLLFYHEALEKLQRECRWKMEDSTCSLSSVSRQTSESSSSVSLQGTSSETESMLYSSEDDPSVHLGEFCMQNFEEIPVEAVPSIVIRPGDEFGATFARCAKRKDDTTLGKKAVRTQVRL